MVVGRYIKRTLIDFYKTLLLCKYYRLGGVNLLGSV